MAWKETCRMKERLRFVLAYDEMEPNGMAALCREFGVSRKTGYKWVHRYDPDDLRSLEDRSRRPHSSPHAIDEKLEDSIVELRRARPRWGPKKLLWALQRMGWDGPLPSRSTIANVIKRHGLVRKKRRRHKVPPFTAPFAGCEAPNDVWCADFKGHFRAGRARCYPLTISDAFSRYLVRCEALRRPRHREVNRVFESAFREFGLPTAIRTDNGPPFASPSVGGLSKLSVWWMRLGIRPERIEPGKPQQNGRHERMHRTLKEETAQPPSSSMRAQQRRFDAFLIDFNQERPHEALGQTTPASWYEASPREYPNHLPQPEYPLGWYVFRVPKNGILPWRGQNIYISDCLANEEIGLNQVHDEKWEVHFCSMLLGHLHRREKKGFKFTRFTNVLPMSLE